MSSMTVMCPWFICWFRHCINHLLAYLTSLRTPFPLTYLLPYLSTSLKIGSFHFQAVGHKRRLNLVLDFVFILCYSVFVFLMNGYFVGLDLVSLGDCLRSMSPKWPPILCWVDIKSYLNQSMALSMFSWNGHVSQCLCDPFDHPYYYTRLTALCLGLPGEPVPEW